MNPLHISRNARAQALLRAADWHRAQSRNFLNNSVQAMEQHSADAERLTAEAAELLAQINEPKGENT